MVAKRGLNGVKRPVHCESLDGHEIRSVRLDGKEKAGARRLTIKQNRARSADSLFAAEVRAAELEILAQEISQQAARLDEPLYRTPVNGQLNRLFCHLSPGATCRQAQ